MTEKTGAPLSQKELAAAIMDAGAHIKITTNIAREVSKVLIATDGSAVPALLELLSQPDPKGHLRVTLRDRAKECLDQWGTSDNEDFAQWVLSANLCFHEVDNLLRAAGDKTTPKRLTAQACQGVRHYRESPERYTDDQMKSFALVSAVAEYYRLKAERAESILVLESINSKTPTSPLTGHDHFDCCALSSDAIKSALVDNPEKAENLIRAIVKNRAYTEEAILQHLPA